MAFDVALNSTLPGYIQFFLDVVVGYIVYGVAQWKAQYLTVNGAVSTQSCQ